jgi:hypothetical protein
MTTRAKNTSPSSAYFNKFLIGYYGRPNTDTMGILGMHKIDDLVPLLVDRAKIYQETIGKDITVVPVFHLIYGMATLDPQKNNSYLIYLTDSLVMKYIDAAQKHGFSVILDIQIGNRIPLDAIKRALPFLKYKNVHLAIDPEFAVTHLPENTRPGIYIGKVTASQVNDVQKAMLDYMNENDIKENKILIIHSFKPRMIQNQENLEVMDRIDLTVNVDGYSNPKVKIDVFDQIITDNIDKKAFAGFKIFLDPTKDVPMMTPKQSLGLDDYKDMKLKTMPSYINMQ